MKKSEFRLKYKRSFQALSRQQVEEKSLLIGEKLFSELLQENYIQKEIGGFFPLDDEPNYFLKREFRKVISSFPLIENEAEMTFRCSNIEELCEETHFGRKFKIPAVEKDIVVPNILIIPGLGFDRLGNRLGRGKGYYDRYLKEYNGIKIGICFHEQLGELIPHDSFDVAVDLIVTDLEIVKVK